ncbi:MAG: leucyl aminopeptidase, partial [Frankiaceae bacterium]|nr:leucyl aminopeptidase [Frankiaceae bacterium]
MHPTVSLVAGPLKADAPVVAVPVRPGDPAPALAAGVDVVAALGVDAAAVLAARKAKGEPGEVIEVPVARDGVDTLAFVGIGDGQPAALRKAAAALVRRAGSATAVATNIADGAEPEGFAAVAEAATLARFSFSRRSEPSDKPPLEVRLVAPARDKAATAAV